MKKLDTVRALVDERWTLTLATVDEDGRARTTPLFYVADARPRVYWFSSAASVHSRNALRAGQAAAAIYAETDEWRKIRGVQMRGPVMAVRDGAARQQIAARYVERFRLGAAPRLALRRATLYCLAPQWVRYLDNARRLGYRFEIELETEEPSWKTPLRG
jgi:uncharacterized protein YhbP (UPF0306 family)